MHKILIVIWTIVMTTPLLSQKKLVFISKKQTGQTVTLTAHNDSEKDMLVTLRIRSKGMMLTDDPYITLEIKSKSTREMISLSPKPGMDGHYNYKLSATPVTPEMEIVEEITSNLERRIVIKNSSKQKGSIIFENVREHLPADTVAYFTKNNCSRCKEIRKALDENKVIYKEFNTSKDEETYSLLWDALLAFGVQDGRVMMPVLFYREDVYHNVEEIEKIIPSLRKETPASGGE